MLPRKKQLKVALFFHIITGVSALAGEKANPKILFTLMLYVVLSTDTQNTLK